MIETITTATPDSNPALKIATEISPAALALIERFETEKAAYIAQQVAFSEVVNEVERLKFAATALDAEASEVNENWHQVAKDDATNYRKVSTLIDREAELKLQAEKMRRMAASFDEIVGEKAIALARIRYELASSVSATNRLCLEERVAAIRSDEDFRVKAAELFRICEQQARNTAFDDAGGMGGHHGVSNARDMSAERKESWIIFKTIIEGFLNSKDAPRAKQPASLPKPVRGEIVALSLVALNRLKKNGGRMPAPNGYEKERLLIQH